MLLHNQVFALTTSCWSHFSCPAKHGETLPQIEKVIKPWTGHLARTWSACWWSKLNTTTSRCACSRISAWRSSGTGPGPCGWGPRTRATPPGNQRQKHQCRIVSWCQRTGTLPCQWPVSSPSETPGHRGAKPHTDYPFTGHCCPCWSWRPSSKLSNLAGSTHSTGWESSDLYRSRNWQMKSWVPMKHLRDTSSPISNAQWNPRR